jgi:hypothetical protein
MSNLTRWACLFFSVIKKEGTLEFIEALTREVLLICAELDNEC